MSRRLARVVNSNRNTEVFAPPADNLSSLYQKGIAAMSDRQSNLSKLLVLACCAAVYGCGGGSGDASPQTAAVSPPDPAIRDLAIAKLAYGEGERVPDGFYREPRLYPDRSEFRFHVKGSDVGIAIGDSDFELCSDDFSRALDWSAASAEARQFETTLSATGDAEWYFQFERTVQDDEPAMVINRVFKCALFDRTGLSADGYAGRLARQPVQADDLKFVSEYLWQFSFYNNALHAVLASTGTREADALVHDIERVEVQIGAGSESGCDRVSLWTWRHRVETASGEMYSEQLFLRAFDARQVNGIVSLCD